MNARNPFPFHAYMSDARRAQLIQLKIGSFVYFQMQQRCKYEWRFAL